MNKSFDQLENSIINCKKCPRLVNFRSQIAKDKRKQYINEKYWGKPITGFGDRKARILLVGLSPGGTHFKAVVIKLSFSLSPSLI